MIRADADAEARQLARQLTAEAEQNLLTKAENAAWLGGWIGRAWAALDQLGKEPEPDDPPEYDPDGEAERIAEVFAPARAEQDRGL